MFSVAFLEKFKTPELIANDLIDFIKEFALLVDKDNSLIQKTLSPLSNKQTFAAVVHRLRENPDFGVLATKEEASKPCLTLIIAGFLLQFWPKDTLPELRLACHLWVFNGLKQWIHFALQHPLENWKDFRSQTLVLDKCYPWFVTARQYLLCNYGLLTHEQSATVTTEDFFLPERFRMQIDELWGNDLREDLYQKRIDLTFRLFKKVLEKFDKRGQIDELENAYKVAQRFSIPVDHNTPQALMVDFLEAMNPVETDYVAPLFPELSPEERSARLAKEIIRLDLYTRSTPLLNDNPFSELSFLIRVNRYFQTNPEDFTRESAGLLATLLRSWQQALTEKPSKHRYKLFEHLERMIRDFESAAKSFGQLDDKLKLTAAPATSLNVNPEVKFYELLPSYQLALAPSIENPTLRKAYCQALATWFQELDSTDKDDVAMTVDFHLCLMQSKFEAFKDKPAQAHPFVHAILNLCHFWYDDCLQNKVKNPSYPALVMDVYTKFIVNQSDDEVVALYAETYWKFFLNAFEAIRTFAQTSTGSVVEALDKFNLKEDFQQSPIYFELAFKKQLCAIQDRTRGETLAAQSIEIIQFLLDHLEKMFPSYCVIKTTRQAIHYRLKIGIERLQEQLTQQVNLIRINELEQQINHIIEFNKDRVQKEVLEGTIEELFDTKRQLDTVKAKLNKTTATLEQKKGEVQLLQNKCADYKKQIAELKKQRSGLQKSFTSTQTLQANSQQEIETLNANLKESKLKLKQSLLEVKGYQTKILALETTVDSFRHTQKSLQVEVSSLQDQNVALIKANQAFAEEQASTSEVHQALQARLEHTEADVKRLTAQLASLTLELTEEKNKHRIPSYKIAGSHAAQLLPSSEPPPAIMPTLIEPLAVPPHIKDVMTKLRGNSKRKCPIFIRGGWVRDTLLGRNPKDVDLITTRPKAWILKNLPQFKQNPNRDNHLIDHENGIDITVVETVDLYQLAQQSDLTVNALFADGMGRVYDPTGMGLSDLKAQKFSVLGDLEERWHKDPAKILRLIRFAVEWDWELPPPLVLYAATYLKNLHERMPLGVYVSNLKKLFQDPKKMLDFCLDHELLGPIFDLKKLKFKLKMCKDLLPFWQQKLTDEFVISDARIFALFLVLEVECLVKMNQNNFEASLDKVISDFETRWGDNLHQWPFLVEGLRIQIVAFYQAYQAFVKDKALKPNSPTYTPSFVHSQQTDPTTCPPGTDKKARPQNLQ